MPLRTCKTILQQVITVFGKTALEELDKMDMTDTSFVGAYLHRLAQSNGPASTMPKQQPKPTSKSRPAHESPPEPLSPRPPADSSRPQSPPSATLSGPADREINQQLKEIFDTIGQPETSKQVNLPSFFGGRLRGH